MKLEKKCPFCSATSGVEVDESAYANYMAGKNILHAFPKMSKFDRELIISGMCYECQEKTFHTPMPGNEEKWGEMLGSCECCDAPIYSKMDDKGGYYECGCCGCTYQYEDGELICED